MSKKQNTNTIIAVGGLTVAAILLFSNKDNKSTPQTAQPIKGGAIDFILKSAPHAVQANKVFPNVPPLIMLAFAGLESGFGKRAPQFNYFGTKPPRNWKGKIQLFDTTEVLPRASGYKFPKVYSVTPYKKDPTKYLWKVADEFKAFNSPYEAFLDFAAFLNTPRYKNALKGRNLREIVQGIKNAGYATAPAYVDNMMRVIELIQKIAQQYAR